MSAEETVNYWLKKNRCLPDGKQYELPDRDPKDGCRIFAKQWQGEAPIVFYTMKGHGHGWPMQRGRTREDTGSSTRDISAPEEFWKFFTASANLQR
jgi:poly(3-hydroxybutyrate) depolymerase